MGNGLEEEDSGEEQPPSVYLRFFAANAYILSNAQLILTGQFVLTFAEIYIDLTKNRLRPKP